MEFVCVTQRSLAGKKTTLISTQASADAAQQLLNFWKDKLEAYNKVNLHSLWTLIRKEELSIMAELT